MLFRSPLAGTLLVRGALAYSRCHTACSSALERTRGALEVFLREALTTQEKASLAHALFGPLRNYGGFGLQPWEQRWYARDLPPAPARVLVGGCGAGRELVGLTAVIARAGSSRPRSCCKRHARAWGRTPSSGRCRTKRCSRPAPRSSSALAALTTR
jgi:hypothetical protein